MKTLKISRWACCAFLGAATLLGATSCSDQPDKYEATDGLPVVKYVRVPNPEASDSLITSAFMDNVICIVGENLRATHEIYFNDQKAVLNTSFITDNTLMVSVPGGIPETVTNTMTLVNAAGQKVEYPFSVLVPAPSVRNMSCEWAGPGDEVTITGDYFINDESIPLAITMPDGTAVTEIKSITRSAVTFVVPETTVPGYISVTSIYGTGRSAFMFRDNRNILFDWDGSHGGIAQGQGWRPGVIHNGSEDGIAPLDGSYLYFGGAEMSGDIGGTWDEDHFAVNYWPTAVGSDDCLQARPEFAEMLGKYKPEELCVKFEMYVPSANAWASSALQVIFTSAETVSQANQHNKYLANEIDDNGVKHDVPRGLYMPWRTTGSYDTADKWVTVTMNFTDFNYDHEGAASPVPFMQSNFDGLTLFLWQGGIAGTTCNPVVCIDNVRVVPIQ